MKSLLKQSVSQWFARNTSSSRLIEAARPVIEGLETRQMLAADLSVSTTRLVYTEVRGGAASPAQKLTLTNVGDQNLNIAADGISFFGGDAALFEFNPAPSLPLSIAPGASADVLVAFNPVTATPLSVRSTTLRVVSDDPDSPVVDVALRGIVTQGLSGGGEASLNQVFQLYQIPITRGVDNIPTLQSLVKAGPGPVTIDVLAVYGVPSNPAVRVGYYNAGTKDSKVQLFTTPTSQAQSVTVTPTGTTTFDPGPIKFGLYTSWPGFTDNGRQREVYTEDEFNQFELTPANRNKIQLYPLKNPDGSTVANAYVVSVEEFVNDTNASYDRQDIVFIIRNVAAPAAGPEIGIENRDGETKSEGSPGSDRLVFSKIQNKGTLNIIKNTGTIRIHNSGTDPLSISKLLITEKFNNQYVTPAFAIDNAPASPLVIASGGFYDLTVRFTATADRVHDGVLAIYSNDADEPVSSVALSGLWQIQNEGGYEPTLTNIANQFGLKTVILGPGQTQNNGGKIEQVGEEILSPFWFAADPTAPIHVRQIAAYHTQGNTGQIRAFPKTNPNSQTTLFIHAGQGGQTILPPIDGSTTDPASAYYSPNPATPIGFRVDSEYSLNTLNTQEQPGGNYGHHVRFWPYRDKTGAYVPNTYFVTMDYYGINYDYNDNIFIISNIRPELSPGAPSNVNALSQAGSTDVTWNRNPEANILGYNVYRSTSAGGTFTKISGATPLSGTSFTDPSGTTSNFFYRVTAVFNNNVEGFPTAAAQSFILPGATNGVNATASGPSSITVGWSDNATETYFTIERSTDNSTWTTAGYAGENVTQFIDTGLTQGVQYFYRVKASNLAGQGPAGGSNSTTIPFVPAAPTVTATATAGFEIDIAWTNVANETGYRVERSLNGSTGWTSIGTTAANVLTLSDTATDANTNYFYRVFAFNVAGDSLASNTPNATTPVIQPDTPTNLTATLVSFSRADLSWPDVFGDNGYKIEWSQNNIDFSQLDTVGKNATKYEAINLLANSRYFFRIRAFNGAGNSGYSNTVTVDLPALAEKVMDNSDTTGVTLVGTWTSFAVSGAIGGSAIGDNNLSKGNRRVIYTPNLLAGSYEIFARWPAAGGRATNTPINIVHAGGTSTVVVNQQQNNNVYVSLGVYTFNAGQGTVTIDNLGTNGVVVADAVRFVNQAPLPLAPTALSASPASGSSISLSWTDNANNESGYKIEAQGPGDSGFNQIAIVTGTTSYTATGLLGNSSYNFRVRAFNQVGNSGYSNTAIAATGIGVAPAAASGLSASGSSSTSIGLSWTDNSNNEQGFRIERKLPLDASFTQVGQVGAGVTTFSNTLLSAETTYVYRVIAFNGSGAADPSNEASTSTRAAAPTNLTGAGVSQTQIDLTWTDVSTVATGYALERQASGEAGFSPLVTLDGSATSYSDAGLTPATNYTYRLRAISATSGDSDTVTSAPISTQGATAPAAPSGLSASAAGSSQINLTWTDNSSNETGFKIFRQAAGEAGFTLIFTTGPNATSYSSAGLVASTLYTYRVFATNGGGDSATFTEAAATTGPAASVDKVIDNSDATGVTLTGTWTSFTNAGSINGSAVGDNNYGKGTRSVTYTPNLPAGTYEVFARWNAASNRATNVPIDINRAGGTTTVVVNQRTSTNNNVYISLGTFTFNANQGSVVIRNTGTDGVVIADAVRFVTAGAPTAPAAPTGVSATANLPTRITVSWNDVAGETGFKILRQAPGQATPTLLTTVGAGVLSYVDNAVLPSSGYSYQIVATNGGADSAPSAVASATTPAAAVETILDNSSGSGVTITGTWAPISNSSSYLGNALGDNNLGKGTRSVTYTPSLAAGTYQIFGRWNSSSNRSSAVPIDVVNASGTTTVFANQTVNNNQWVLLGTFTINAGQGAVTIKNNGTTGVVIADAVRWLKVG